MAASAAGSKPISEIEIQTFAAMDSPDFRVSFLSEESRPLRACCTAESPKTEGLPLVVR